MDIQIHDGLHMKDDLYNQWEQEYQRYSALIDNLKALVTSWRQKDAEVKSALDDCILAESVRSNAIAHMTERAACANAVEDIIKRTTPPALSEPEAEE